MSTPRRTPYTTADLHFWWSAEHTPPALEVNCASPNKRGDYLLRIRSGYSTARLWAEQTADALALAGELERCAREIRSQVEQDTGTPAASVILAAAPALYDALLLALPELERTFDEMGPSETDHYPNANCGSACGLPRVIEAARSALARACGEVT